LAGQPNAQMQSNARALIKLAGWRSQIEGGDAITELIRTLVSAIQRNEIDTTRRTGSTTDWSGPVFLKVIRPS
jgi:hypothetical protein